MIITVDNLSTVSRPFSIIPTLALPSCGGLVLDTSKTNIQPDSTIVSGSQITLTFKVYDNSGNSYNNFGTVNLIADYIADGPTILNPQVYQISSLDGSTGSISNQIDINKGSVTLSFTLSGPAGAVYLKARMLSQIGIPNSADVETASESLNQLTLSDVLAGTPYSALTMAESLFVEKSCESDIIRLNVISLNSIGMIQIDTPLTTSNFTTNISMGTPKILTLTMYDTKGQLLKNKLMKSSGNFIQVPPYLVGANQNTFCQTYWNSPATDNTGKISAT